MFPKVENPIPDTVGLGTIFNAAGACGVLFFVLASMLGLPDTQRDAWGKRGITTGFFIGSAAYLITLLAQLLCRQ